MSTETVVRERPILFSGPMVRALLDGRKSQTRRVVKLPPAPMSLGSWAPTTIGGPNGGRTASGETIPAQGAIWHTRTGATLACPYGAPGDRLWVRETWGWNTFGGGPIDDEPEQREIVYRASRPTPLGLERWRPSIHMPRAFSRLTLEITDVRVQRVQEISEADCEAEGIYPVPLDVRNALVKSGRLADEGRVVATSRDYFRTLWDSLNAARGYGWDTSPWVWALTFRRVEVET